MQKKKVFIWQSMFFAPLFLLRDSSEGRIFILLIFYKLGRR